jgi:hypothetical protein
LRSSSAAAIRPVLLSLLLSAAVRTGHVGKITLLTVQEQYGWTCDTRRSCHHADMSDLATDAAGSKRPR